MKAFTTIAAGFMLLLTAAASLGAQPSNEDIPIAFDVAFFRYDNAQTYCELYYSVPDTGISYRMKDGRYIGELYLAFEVADKVKKHISYEWIVESTPDKPVKEYINDIVGLKTFLLPPGEYELTLYVGDVALQGEPAKLPLPFLTPAFPENKVSLGSIELAQSIRSATDAEPESYNDAYRKGSLIIHPNPGLIFAGTAPVLHFYTEMYNCKKFMPAGFAVRYEIISTSGRRFLQQSMPRQAVTDAQVEYASIPIDSLPSGRYRLEVSIVNPHRNMAEEARISKRFYVVNPERPPVKDTLVVSDEMFARSEFSTFTGERLQHEYELYKIIASTEEVALYNSLGDDLSRARFLYRQWSDRDPNRATLHNERREQFLQDLRYVNTYFGHLQMEGWQTDRGRVLLQYGQPDERDIHAFEPENRPYEVWTYTQIQGGVIFAFVDLQGYGNYTLIHSTAQDEPRYEDWKERFVTKVRADGVESDETFGQ